LDYARRETKILKEISHPNIMKVVDYWEPELKLGSNAAMALGYVCGPTVEALLRHDGALSLTFGRVVIAQVLDAISFLHSRAVVHRDVKPDNIIVSGASSKQDEIWDSKQYNEGGEDCLLKKWHVTLVDFGFARALTPEDVAMPSDALKRETNLDASYHQVALGDLKPEHKEKEPKVRGKDESLDKSVSRKFVRKMSALGNRNFCAPEILSGLLNDDSVKAVLTTDDITETLSTCVSEYGLMVDAYSVGKTFRYMMTGVPPHRGVEAAIAEQKSPINRLSRWAKKRLSDGKPPKKRKVQYRLESELPMEVQQLITDLTMRNEDERTSAWRARRYK
jgi:serine/threonine protein kinase